MTKKIGYFLGLLVAMSIMIGTWTVPVTAGPAKQTKPEPPLPGKVLKNPLVSIPVSPSDTSGLPTAPRQTPNTGKYIEARPALTLPREGQITHREGFTDPVRQTQYGPLAMPAATINFEGQSINDGGGYAPPIPMVRLDRIITFRWSTLRPPYTTRVAICYMDHFYPATSGQRLILATTMTATRSYCMTNWRIDGC